MKQQILAIIRKHNNIATYFEGDNTKIDMSMYFKLAGLSSEIASEGLQITKLARENGIDAKCNLQSGYITVYGELN